VLNGWPSSLSFNAATNQITSGGFTYDAAGNMTGDLFHAYTYDAEGNMTAADSGSTAKYTYDAFNRKVRIDVPTDVNEFLLNPNGQRASYWDPVHGWEVQGQAYWGSAPVEFYEDNYQHFQHQDWLGTERARTTYTGAVEGTFQSLPFGDGQTTSGTPTVRIHIGLSHSCHDRDRRLHSGSNHPSLNMEARICSVTATRYKCSPPQQPGTRSSSNPGATSTS
jgi:hypothetical protein